MALNPFDMPGDSRAILVADLTCSAGAYAAGDNVGGVKTLANAVINQGGSARLMTVMALDLANQKIVGALYLFSANPSASTSTDNAAQTIAVADVPKLLARIPIAAADYVTIDGKGVAHLRLSGPALLQAASTSRDIYAVFVTEGIPTYGAGANLLLRLGLEARS